MPIKRTKKKRRSRYKRGEYTSLKSGQVCKYRSGWEAAYMAHLDDNADVKSWGYECFHIEYLSNKSTGKMRKYIPDFRIERTDGSVELVEIKPSKKLCKPTVQKKIRAAQDWCSINGVVFRIITEIELKNLGLL